MLKYLLWLKLGKYGKIDAKGGIGITRNPMRPLYTLHPEDYTNSDTLVKGSVIGETA